MTPIRRARRAVMDELHRQKGAGLVTYQGMIQLDAIVRAVIAAIREPSEGMITAAEDKEAQSPRGTARNMWTAQIDALLEDGE